MATEPQFATDSLYVERDSDRKIRHRNKLYYRFNHWPIWIFVFFIAPGPRTFDLFERGFDVRLLSWLGVVLIGTGIAGLFGCLPGCEPRPYIIRFTEDRPNPLYRRICYTTAWGEVIAFALFVIFRVLGRTYDAAVICAGFIGFGVGATPTAMANMTAVTQRHGPSHIAFLIVPLVGAFFIDVVNTFVIRAFMSIL